MAGKNVDTTVYQDSVVKGFEAIFGEGNVIREWDVAKESMDDYTRKLYCPRIDVAVGPLNIERSVSRNNQKIEEAVLEYKWFIKKLLANSEAHVGSVGDFLSMRNMNPRCFLAVEIENSGTRKHLLGDVVNVSIIGAIGLVVPLNRSRLNGFKGIKKYIEFAMAVGKLKSSFNNVIVINRDNFLNVISKGKKHNGTNQN